MKTILLVDDSPTVRKVVELTFGGTDIRVEAASSGNEALERIHELAPARVTGASAGPAAPSADRKRDGLRPCAAPFVDSR